MGFKPPAGSAGSTALARTAVKTANYTAVPGDLVACDPTSGAFTVTLPSAPADKAQVEVKIITATAPNVVTIATAGSDVLNRTGGATSTTLQVPGHSNTFQYDAATSVWTITQSDTPLAQLDARYRVPSVAGVGNRVAALGDSITFGNSSVDNSLHGDRDILAWAHLLSDAKILYQRNAGVSGNRSDQMLARVQSDIIAYAPDWCLVESGTNDAASGFSLATYVSNMTAIIAALKAANIKPVLWVPPPNPSSGAPNQRQLQDQYAAWMRYYAAQNRIPLVDPRPKLIDPTTGGYLSALDFGDGIHPNAAGAKIIGQAIVDVLGPLLPNWAPPLALFQTADAQNMLPGALFLTNTSGVGTSWTKAGSGVATTVAPTGAEILGNWQRITDTVNEFTQVQYNAFAGGTWAVGDRLAFAGRVQNDNTGGQFSVQLTCTGGSPSQFKPISGFTVPFPAHTFYQEIVIPAGTTALQVLISVQGSASLDARIAQMRLLNLTKLGIA